jgi:hypothetical protein
MNPRDIRCIWIVHPRSFSPIKVDLGSGWAQAIAKVHGDVPIHASAWKKGLAILKTRLSSKISAYNYQREMSRIKREQLLELSKKTTRKYRKEKEKVKEIKRKSVSQKIRSNTNITDKNIEKEENAARSTKKKKIDWDNVPIPWTDDFYSGDL